MLRVVDLVRHERVHGRAGLERAVIAVVDLDARSGVDGAERVRHRAELRRELLVGQPGHEQLAVDEGHVRDRIGARIPSRGRARSRRIRQFRPRVLQIVRLDDFDRSGAVDPQEGRLGVGALAAHDGKIRVARFWMHRQVGDLDFACLGAEHRRDLLIDRRNVLRTRSAAGGAGAQVDRKDRRGLRVGGEQGPVRRKSQRSDRLQCRTRTLGRRLRLLPGVGGHVRSDAIHQRQDGNDEHRHSETSPLHEHSSTLAVRQGPAEHVRLKPDTTNTLALFFDPAGKSSSKGHDGPDPGLLVSRRIRVKLSKHLLRIRRH